MPNDYIVPEHADQKALRERLNKIGFNIPEDATIISTDFDPWWDPPGLRHVSVTINYLSEIVPVEFCDRWPES
jgi:hypothetical protein